MIRGHYGQAVCENCRGWHYAINIDNSGTIREFKCTRCGLITPASAHKFVVTPPLKEVKPL